MRNVIAILVILAVYLLIVLYFTYEPKKVIVGGKHIVDTIYITK